MVERSGYPLLSIRKWDEHGDDIELGMIRDLADWPAETQVWLQNSLDRRYLLRRISKIYGLRLALGFLEFDVETDTGRMAFLMRWTQSTAVSFGSNGKLLIDTDDNRYVVNDVN